MLKVEYIETFLSLSSKLTKLPYKADEPIKRLIEGPCGHCHHAVAFKEPEQHACLKFEQTIKGDEDEVDEERTHYFIMGICPRPRCQQATIIYRQECEITHQGYSQNHHEVLQERIIFPASSSRNSLPDEVPASLRELYHEASSIENLEILQGIRLKTNRVIGLL